MALYTFTCKDDGSEIDLVYSMSDAPEFGTKIRRDGKTYERLIQSLRTATVGAAPAYCFKSVQVEDFHPAAPHHDAEGNACFDNKQQVREFVAKTAENDLSWQMDGRK